MFADVCRCLRSFVFACGVIIGLLCPLPVFAVQLTNVVPPVVGQESCEDKAWREWTEKLDSINAEYDEDIEWVKDLFRPLRQSLNDLITSYENDPNLTAAQRAHLINLVQQQIVALDLAEANAILDLERLRALEIRLAWEDYERKRDACRAAANPVPVPVPVPDMNA